ncbi:MAG: hypothetical protein ACM3XM_15085 [Mycobacterium leprae]
MREQLLAADNFVMGTTNILLIALPDGWRMLEGHAAPEVERWSTYRDRRWMLEGRAPYRLVRPHPDKPQLVAAEVELCITAKSASGRYPRGNRLDYKETGQVAVGEHKGQYRLGTIRRGGLLGLLPGMAVPALHLDLLCFETGRRIHLELNALRRGHEPTATESDLRALLRALQDSFRCH